MNYTVVYYTRTGTSKRVAEKIADRLSCPIKQITDNINWKGIFGFLKAGFYSSTNKQVDFNFDGDLDSADEIITVAPFWAGGLAPTMRSFLKTLRKDKVHLVVVSDGSHLKDRSGFQSVFDITRNYGNEDREVESLVGQLTKGK